jgi:hypothetical protein
MLCESISESGHIESGIIMERRGDAYGKWMDNHRFDTHYSGMVGAVVLLGR